MASSRRKVGSQKDESPMDKKIQENIANWHTLAPLDDEQLDVIYEVEDLVKDLYYKGDLKESEDKAVTVSENETDKIPMICSNRDFIRWMIKAEEEVKHEDLNQFNKYNDLLAKHLSNFEELFNLSENTLTSLEDLKEKYHNATEKTNYLHDLSEQLLVHQKTLKEKKQSINEKLKYFVYYNKCHESIDRLGNRVNTAEYIEILNTIDEAIQYLNDHIDYKESKAYKIKYESLLSTALLAIYNYVNSIIVDTTKLVVDPDFKAHLLPQVTEATDSAMDSAFSLYYGKFQSASVKVRLILEHLEAKEDCNSHYKNNLFDCQKSYFSQRQPILSVAVLKALTELKEKHKNDYSVLFRSSCLFTMKVCMDEAKCYNYFFSKSCSQLNDYLGALCEYLYDILRPCLITIHHIEILCELCGILKREMLNDSVYVNEHLSKYTEVVKRLLEDVEERLVFRTNIFFKHDLTDYKPSPGDLAYPEKLQQMENVVVDMRERKDSRASSVVSMESQEVAHINAPQLTHFRSYTGNSPADLHGMWYPTVKRTLVCLSRLYFCLDRDTFQGLAQEALLVCTKTLDHAAELICVRKSIVDGKLFQIKHLLIIREQIAPFQVDFTTKELALDFSGVQKAAVDLLQNRSSIFKLSSSNALLEFLLEGTPKVKEYLVDSRKEIDKELKRSCEYFIGHVTKLLIGNVLDWLDKAEHILKIIQAENTSNNDLTVVGQSFGKPEVVGAIVKEAQKNMKTRIPEVQASMQLYLANRETEFILFRPIKNNLLNAFMQVEQILQKGGYTAEDQLEVACPSQEQINILICSVSLTSEQTS